MTASTVTDTLGIVVTLLLGAITAYVGLSVRLKARQEVATTVSERRFSAYAALWAETAVAAPMLAAGRPPLTGDQLAELYRQLTAWYYKAGNGMLLSEQARAVYLGAKNNLVCPIDDYVPESLRATVLKEGRSDAAIRQLSLLRTAMRGDLEIYAGPWGKELNEQDGEFLRACKVDPAQEPWRSVTRRQERAFIRARRWRPRPRS